MEEAGKTDKRLPDPVCSGCEIQKVGCGKERPDGITDNVSKKKIRQQEKEAAEKAAKAYEARKNPVQESEEKKPLSGDPERPYSRGRAYDPAHYGRKRPAGSDAEQTEE